MKKRMILLSIVFLVTAAVSVIAGDFPCSPYGPAIIAGNIIDGEEQVGGAHVSVVCHHNGDETTVNTMSSTYSGYMAVFPLSKCDVGDLVEVTAVKDEKSGYSSGTVGENSHCIYGLDVEVINVSIPEFGTVTAGLALVGAAAVVMFRRRKKRIV